MQFKFLKAENLVNAPCPNYVLAKPPNVFFTFPPHKLRICFKFLVFGFILLTDFSLLKQAIVEIYCASLGQIKKWKYSILKSFKRKLHRFLISYWYQGRKKMQEKKYHRTYIVGYQNIGIQSVLA